MTFEQAEGKAPLPTQLDLREVSPQLRSSMWELVYASMLKCQEFSGFELLVKGLWLQILYEKHVLRDNQMADEFKSDFNDQTNSLKHVFKKGAYHEFYGLTEWLLRRKPSPITRDAVNRVLERCQAPYRVYGEIPTVVPVASEAERENLELAFANLAATEFAGAREHLRKAAEALTSGEYANSIRESIHAVESVARTIAGKPSLSDALAEIEKTHKLHPALKKGFANLYGFTSDEQGIRHPLLEKGAPGVDETDAIFLLGACAAFVSYLIKRARA